jgi:stress-induced-phosphoprotein 1
LELDEFNLIPLNNIAACYIEKKDYP